MRKVRNLLLLLSLAGSLPLAAQNLPANTWVQICEDQAGARMGSATRYADGAGAFFLWGFMNDDPELLQEQPLMVVPEYDMVAFDPAQGRWRSHLPKAWEELWSKKLPLAYNPGTYSGKTSGSERIVMRGPSEGEAEAVPRPDLNLVFDQVAYYPPGKSLFYFTGGLTAVYNVAARRWSDLMPPHSPPPVTAGTLAYDPVHNAMVLFGGGHVAEPDARGKLVGYTGTWVYEFAKKDWRKLQTGAQPPPRMNTRLVCDTKNQVLVVFGGDSQTAYLADTWLFDLKARTWRQSKAASGPEARAGHFTVFDPQTGWVIVGGGYNTKNLTDLWAYDAAEDRWRRLAGEVPTGFYITGDIAPEKRLIMMLTCNRKPGDRRACNALYPVRTTYAYRIDEKTIVHPDQTMAAQATVPKRSKDEETRGTGPDPTRQKAQADRLKNIPVNQWVHLADPGRVAPDRTWGSATFDSDRGRILYWGGEHCGYSGNDVDAYDLVLHTWLATPGPESAERAWDHGYSKDSSMGLAGVTFGGNPWNVHARRIYTYDPVSKKMIVARPIRLTTGYNPAPLRAFPGKPRAHDDALVNPPPSYDKWATWSFDPDRWRWELLGPAPVSLDTLVTTPHGAVGVIVDWPSRLNDAGYTAPWNPSMPAKDTAVYLFDAAAKQWKRLGAPQTCPQNLYESVSLAYDSKRDQILFHGGGEKRNELWTFSLKTNRWAKMKAPVKGGGDPPQANREAVYIPREDTFLITGQARAGHVDLWAYKVGADEWQRLELPMPVTAGAPFWSSQNRAMVYDPARDLVLLVLGTGGDNGKASVFALRYQPKS